MKRYTRSGTGPDTQLESNREPQRKNLIHYESFFRNTTEVKIGESSGRGRSRFRLRNYLYQVREKVDVGSCSKIQVQGRFTQMIDDNCTNRND